MATDTPFIGLERPSKGEYNDEWHLPVNRNWKAIDDNAVGAGTQANRPEPETEGRKYVSIDESVLYYDNGSSWDSIAGRDLKGDDLMDGTTTIWDATNQHVPGDAVEDVFVLNTGDTINGDLDFGGSGGLLNLLNTDFEPRSSAPSHSVGRIVLSDGTDFDPDSDGTAELLISDGSAWTEIVDLGTSL